MFLLLSLPDQPLPVPVAPTDNKRQNYRRPGKYVGAWVVEGWPAPHPLFRFQHQTNVSVTMKMQNCSSGITDLLTTLILVMRRYFPIDSIEFQTYCPTN